MECLYFVYLILACAVFIEKVGKIILVVVVVVVVVVAVVGV